MPKKQALNATGKNNPIHATYLKCERARKVLAELGRVGRVVEDCANGRLLEWWFLPGGKIVVLHASVDGWDIYKPITDSGDVDITLLALRELAAE